MVRKTIVFTHLIILREKPWFVYASSEREALGVAKKYEDQGVSIVVAPDGLEVMNVEYQPKLVSQDIKLLDKIVDNENADIIEEMLEEECLEESVE